MAIRTWGELKEYCERMRLADDAPIMVLKSHDPDVGFGEDGYDYLWGDSFIDTEGRLNVQ